MKPRYMAAAFFFVSLFLMIHPNSAAVKWVIPADRDYLQNVLDVASEGDEIFIECGVIELGPSEGIEFSDKNITLSGVSERGTTFKLSGSSFGFRISRGNNSNTVIRNLIFQFDPNGRIAPATAIIIESASPTLENIRVLGENQSLNNNICEGIRCRDSRTRLYGCYFHRLKTGPYGRDVCGAAISAENSGIELDSCIFRENFSRGIGTASAVSTYRSSLSLTRSYLFYNEADLLAGASIVSTESNIAISECQFIEESSYAVKTDNRGQLRVECCNIYDCGNNDGVAAIDGSVRSTNISSIEPSCCGRDIPVFDASSIEGCVWTTVDCRALHRLLSLRCDCCFIRGDANLDGALDVSDLTAIVDYYYSGNSPAGCIEESDINGDGIFDEQDIRYMYHYQFEAGPPPPPCPD